MSGSAEPASPNDPVDATALEGAGDDESLDLARALSQPVDAELAQIPLRGVIAHVAPATKDLHDAIGAPPGGLGCEELGDRRTGMDDLRLGHPRGHSGG